MSRLDTIFFDWGGVIADDPGDDFLKQLLRGIGANEDQVQEIYQSYMRRFMRGEVSEAQYWQELRANYGFKIDDSISQEFQNWNGLIVNDRVLELADQAKTKGLRTAVLSNIIEPTYNVLAASGHFEHFDDVIASFKVGSAKPEEAIYHIATERLQTIPQRSAFIDDKQTNLDAAATLGFTTILAENPDQTVADLTRLVESL